MAREPVQLVNFSRREKTPRDLDVIRLLPDAFEIDADVGVCGDRDEGEIA